MNGIVLFSVFVVGIMLGTLLNTPIRSAAVAVHRVSNVVEVEEGDGRSYADYLLPD